VPTCWVTIPERGQAGWLHPCLLKLGPLVPTTPGDALLRCMSRRSRLGRVDDWRDCHDGGEWRFDRRGRCLSPHVVAPFPVAARRTGHADLPHPALGQGITLSPTEGRASLATDA
jgi:hypothetical protein